MADVAFLRASAASARPAAVRPRTPRLRTRRTAVIARLVITVLGLAGAAMAAPRRAPPPDRVFSLMDYVDKEEVKRQPEDDGRRPVRVQHTAAPDLSSSKDVASGWTETSRDDAYSVPTPAKAVAGPGAPGDGNGPYSLNLVDASIQEAAEAVLGDIFKVNYTVDPKLDGKVTLRTTTPVDRAGISQLFESALRSTGASVVRNGNLYRVVPGDQATTGAAIGLGRSAGRGLGNTLQVVPLRYVAAAEMKRLLEPITAFGGVVRLDVTRNELMLGGTDGEIAALRDAIAVFDRNVLRGVSSALVPVHGLDPEEVTENLTRAFATGGEGAMSGMVQLIPNKRLRAVLVISRQPQYVAAARAWIKRIDGAAGVPLKRVHTYSVRNRQAKDLVEVVNAMFSEEAGETEVRTPRAAARSADAASPTGVPVSSDLAAAQGFAVAGGAAAGSGLQASFGAIPVQASFGLDRSAEPSQARFEGPTAIPAARIGTAANGETRMKIVADPSQNALLVLSTDDDFRRVLDVLEGLDVVPNQVLIEATIAEVTLNDGLRFGVRWFLQNGNGNKQATFSDLATGAVGAAFPGFSFAAHTVNNGQVVLNALDGISHVRVLASPSLMVLDKRTATLQIGNEVPITTQSAQSILTPGAPIVNSIAYKDTGVILAVTPKVSESGRILLDIDQEVSTVSRTDTSNIDSPTFGRRKLHTSVVVNDGENLTLGGLIQDRTTHVETEVPILGDLPIIGNAFKDKEDTIEKTELIILLTPHVVRDLNEARAVTDEYRNKIESLVPRQEPFHRTLRNIKRVLQ